jgi:orotate phosphoribosyltransferase
MEQYKRDFIAFLEGAGVLKFGDFTAKSGRKIPYFINAGEIRTGAQITRLGECYAEAYLAKLGKKPCVLFGPAYKGIPLAVAAAAALAAKGLDLPFFFNRKEAKDHGEGGNLVGCKPADGMRVAIIEDVVTAGTAVRESIRLLRDIADVDVCALFVSVDRMERGTGSLSALAELREQYGIAVYPIVTVREIIEALHNVPVDGHVLLDDTARDRMEAYLAEYGAL